MVRTNPTSAESSWYEREVDLLAALQRGDDVARRSITIPGCVDLRVLLCGGQGRVYAGVQEATGRPIAVKVLREDHHGTLADRRRFEREIEIVSSLDHPHLVPIIDHGSTADGLPYLIMPLIEGAPLDEHLLGPRRDDTTLHDVHDVLRLMLDACDAIHYAHQHGVIHRDIKPSNIRVDRDGRAHVLDFGLAVELDPERRQASRAVTSTGQFLGSLAWASPEQVEAAPDGVDVRSDVYELGVVLYQMLTGRLPFDTADSLRETLRRIAEESPPPPRQWRAMDEDVETIVQRCLAKRPERRYQSVGDIARDIRRYLAGEPIEARRDSAWERAQTTLRRYRVATSAAGIVLVLLVAATTATTILYRRAEHARDIAQEQRVQAHVQAAAARATIAFLEEILTESDPIIRGSGEATLASVVGHAADRYRTALRGQPASMAQIAYVLGRSSFHQGDFDTAEQLTREGIAIEQTRLDGLPGAAEPSTMRLAELHELLGLISHAKHRFEEAEQHFARSIELRPEGRHDTDARSQHSMIDLANVYAAQGRYALARSIWSHAAETAAPADRALAVLFLGRLASTRGEMDEAQRLLEMARPLIVRHHGATSLYAATADYAIARLRLAQSRYDEAIASAEQAMAAFESWLGADSVRVLDCSIVVAEAVARGGDLPDDVARSIDLLRRAVEGYRASPSSGPVDVARGLERLGAMLELDGRYDEAVPVLREALDGFATHQGEDGINAALVRLRLGCTLMQTGSSEEARALLERARSVLEPVYEPQSARLRELADCLAADGG